MCNGGRQIVSGFNEAAGFTRRKPRRFPPGPDADVSASMRPPDLPGGNRHGSVVYVLPTGGGLQ